VVPLVQEQHGQVGTVLGDHLHVLRVGARPPIIHHHGSPAEPAGVDRDMPVGGAALARAGHLYRDRLLDVDVAGTVTSSALVKAHHACAATRSAGATASPSASWPLDTTRTWTAPPASS